MKSKLTSWRRFLLGSGCALAVLGAGVSREAAAMQLCSAALDVDVHYCLNDPMVPACPVTTDPLALEVGDAVTVTLEVTNDSQFQEPPAAPPPGNPPQGVLQGAGAMPPQNRATFKIFYACGASTCNPGEELPTVFTFNSATVLGAAVGKATFADDGNGYSGTLTIDNDILYDRGDSSGKFLVQINLTVASTPPMPPSNGQTIFARANGSQAALLLTDIQCIAGLTGTGQGSTAAMFAAPPPKDLEPCQHPNKQTIVINRFGTLPFVPEKTLEHSNSRVAFRMPGYDPAANTLVFGYADANGTIFDYPAIPMNGFQQVSASCYQYGPFPERKNSGGVSFARLCEIEADKWCLDFKGYADFNASLPPSKVMWMTVSTAAMTFAGPKRPTYAQDATWKTIPPDFVPANLASQWYLPQTAWKK